MLLMVTVALAGLAVLLAVRWLGNTDIFGARKPFPTVVVSLLVVGATGAATPVVRHEAFERRLARVASALAGRPVTVHCQLASEAFVDPRAELGWVRFNEDGTPEPTAYLKREQCDHLQAWLGDGRREWTDDHMLALHVLTHESMHLAGLSDEARTECAAVQRDALTARLFGARAEVGRELAWRYWSTVYPFMPPDYRSPQCRPGGAWDEHRVDAPWLRQP